MKSLFRDLLIVQLNAIAISNRRLTKIDWKFVYSAWMPSWIGEICSRDVGGRLNLMKFLWIFLKCLGIFFVEYRFKFIETLNSQLLWKSTLENSPISMTSINCQNFQQFSISFARFPKRSQNMIGWPSFSKTIFENWMEFDIDHVLWHMDSGEQQHQRHYRPFRTASAVNYHRTKSE